jgi:hypothetical protein
MRSSMSAVFLWGLRMSKWVWLASIAMMSSSVGAAVPDTSRTVDEGMNRSRIMLNAHELLDGIGPRLTISTNMRRAQDWATAKFTGYGLTNVHREGFAFGRGWDLIAQLFGVSGLSRLPEGEVTLTGWYRKRPDPEIEPKEIRVGSVSRTSPVRALRWVAVIGIFLIALILLMNME